MYNSQSSQLYDMINCNKVEYKYAEEHKINIQNINHKSVLETLSSLKKALHHYNETLETLSNQNNYRSYVRFCIYRKDLKKLFNHYVPFVKYYLLYISLNQNTPDSNIIMQELIKAMVWMYNYKVHPRETPNTDGLHYEALMNQMNEIK
jgi:hypothetical protein